MMESILNNFIATRRYLSQRHFQAHRGSSQDSHEKDGKDGIESLKYIRIYHLGGVGSFFSILETLQKKFTLYPH